MPLLKTYHYWTQLSNTHELFISYNKNKLIYILLNAIDK